MRRFAGHGLVLKVQALPRGPNYSGLITTPGGKEMTDEETNDEAVTEDKAVKVDFWALKEYALDIYGLNVPNGTAKAELCNLLEREGEDLTTIHERIATSRATKTTIKKPTPGNKVAGAKTVLGHVFVPDPIPEYNVIDTIMIYEDDKDNKPVFVAVNSRSCYIPRGKEMPIRRPLRLALANAIEESYNPETKEVTRRPRFPFTVIQYDVSGTNPTP